MTVLCIVFAVIILLFIAVLLIDAVPCVLTWIERIGIGSLPEETATEKIKETAVSWLLKTPSVPLSDETRLTVIDRAKGRYKSSVLQSWQKAALLLGAGEAGEADAVKRFCDEQIENGRFKNFVRSPDFALLSYAVLFNAKDRQSLKGIMDEVYGFLKEIAKDGTVPYNVNIGDIRFVDTLGMVCPFLMLYAKTYGVTEAETLAKRQLFEYEENGMSEKTGLPVHCFDIKTGAPLGVCGWGRGCGWYALALAEMLRTSPDEELLSSAENFMKSVMVHRLGNGGFSRQIPAEKMGEASATAMICHLSAVLYKLTGKKEYRECADGGASFIRLSTRKNGKVDYAQGDTKGIGFYSKKLDTMPAAQGFSLLLLAEVNS